MRLLVLLTLFASFAAHAQIILLRGGGSNGASAPSSNGVVAANATVTQNSVCTLGSGNPLITPSFYMEIGDATGRLWSYQVGSVYATTGEPAASASKLQYAMYIAAKRNGYANFTAADIAALNFTDGYNNMGSVTTGNQCPPSGTIASCLLLTGTIDNTHLNNYQNPSAIGKFDYDAGHQENHAAQYQSELVNASTASIYPLFVTAYGLAGPYGQYAQPLMSGGLQTSAAHYAAVLKQVLNSAAMISILGKNQVCAWKPSVGGGCVGGVYFDPISGTYQSPIGSMWHYSIGHWVEDDATQNNDQSFSSPGAFGGYPWFQPTCPTAAHPGNVCWSQAEVIADGTTIKYYGILWRSAPSGSSPTGNGQASGACAALVRHAWNTGVQQTGAIPVH